LNKNKTADLKSVYWPAKSEVLTIFRKLTKDLKARQFSLPMEYKFLHNEIYTNICLVMTMYSLHLAWWIGVKNKYSRAAFISAEQFSHAAVHAGIKCSYWAHGLISRYIVLPEFNEYHLMTDSEKDYLDCLMGREVASVYPSQAVDTAGSKTVLVVGVQCGPKPFTRFCQDATEKLRRLIEELNLQGFTIYVKPHHTDGVEYWNQNFGDLSLVSPNQKFMQTIDTLKPRVIVSWFSTTLAESLNMEIMPVTLSDDSCEYVQGIVYPLLKRCLNYPKDKQLLLATLNSPEKYEKVIEHLSQ
jgi:hypothetical protein